LDEEQTPVLNFTGCASLTDFAVYRLARYLAANAKNGQSQRKFMFKDCPHITIWSVYYMLAGGSGHTNNFHQLLANHHVEHLCF
jgi:hypothetical protein